MHFISLNPHDRCRKEVLRMDIKCLTCGRVINLDHVVFENYFGTVKCFSCSSMMEVKIRDRVLREASVLTLKKHFSMLRDKYANPSL